MKMMRIVLATAVATLAATQVHAEDADLTSKLSARISAMSETQQAALLLLLDKLEASPAAAAAAAPAPAPAETPEIAVKSTLDEFKSMVANKSLNLDKLLERLSEDFTHPVVGDKAGAVAFIKNLDQSGLINQAIADIEIFIDDAEYEVDGDEADIYPIDVDTPFGSVTLGLYGKNENGVWRVTEISGL